MRLRGASLPFLVAVVLSASAGGQEPPADVSGATIDLRLDAPLPADVKAAIPDPLPIPREWRTEIYRKAFGPVWQHLEDVPPHTLFADAARLGRIRQRQTADVRKATGERFSTWDDLMAHPEAYLGRPFTIWGVLSGVNTLRRSLGEDESAEPLYAATFWESGDASFRVLLTAPPLGRRPAEIPIENSTHVELLSIPVSVTGFVFRCLAPDEREPRLVLVASEMTHHIAAHPPLPLEPVEHRAPVLPDEADAFYRFLKHAQFVNYQEQIEAAVEFRRERIEQLPADSEADYRHRMQEAARLRREQPQAQAAYRKAIADARRIREYEQKLAPRLAEQPSEFPLVAALFWSIDSADPKRWRGRPVTLSGNMRKLVSYAADRENPYQVGTLYEAWLFSDDTRSLPSVVVASDIPAGIPRGEDLNERVSVTGYFFKIYAYRALNGRVRYAPLILAQEIAWQPRSENDDFGIPPVVWVLSGVVVVGLVIVVWRTSRSDRRAARRLLSDSPPKLDL